MEEIIEIKSGEDVDVEEHIHHHKHHHHHPHYKETEEQMTQYPVFYPVIRT